MLVSTFRRKLAKLAKRLSEESRRVTVRRLLEIGHELDASERGPPSPPRSRTLGRCVVFLSTTTYYKSKMASCCADDIFWMFFCGPWNVTYIKSKIKRVILESCSSHARGCMVDVSMSLLPLFDL